MTAALVVEVIGLPAPQGSKRHVGRGILIESSKHVGPWRDSVAWAVAAAMRAETWTQIDGPCEIDVAFYLPRPPSAPKKRTEPDRKPDLDKLLRSTLDAITTAGAIADDARVVSLIGRKRYAGPGGRAAAGCVISIRPTETEDA